MKKSTLRAKIVDAIVRFVCTVAATTIAVWVYTNYNTNENKVFTHNIYSAIIVSCAWVLVMTFIWVVNHDQNTK